MELPIEGKRILVLSGTGSLGKVLTGGFCIIDDQVLKGYEKAFDDHRAKNQIDNEIKGIDWSGIYWRKS
jgi:hypothetical protein